MQLAGAGRSVRVALLGAAVDLKGEAAAALTQARPGIDLREIAEETGLNAAMEGAALILDAVVGTGFKPPLRGLALTARDLLAKSSVPVVAVDLPSGWDADCVEQTGEGAFRADAVVTFTAPKLAHVFGHLTPGKTFGPWGGGPHRHAAAGDPVRDESALGGSGEGADRSAPRHQRQ